MKLQKQSIKKIARQCQIKFASLAVARFFIALILVNHLAIVATNLRKYRSEQYVT